MTHTAFLNDIKQQINASYVSYECYRDKYHLKIIKNRGQKADYFSLHGTPDDVTGDSYLKTLNNLKEYYGE